VTNKLINKADKMYRQLNWMGGRHNYNTIDYNNNTLTAQEVDILIYPLLY